MIEKTVTAQTNSSTNKNTMLIASFFNASLIRREEDMCGRLVEEKALYALCGKGRLLHSTL